MTSSPNPWRPSALLLLLSGMLITGIGLFFIAVRPPLLPEDVRYMELSPDELAAIAPRLGKWLEKVFTVLGGFALATGLLIVSLAMTSFRTRHPVALAGAVAGGLASIGLMSAVNVSLDSDFKWLLLGFASVWALSLLLYLMEALTPRIPSSISSQTKESEHETP